MCVIAVKPAGTPLPSNETLKNMWERNPDGAGFMYASGGVVHIQKGFMGLRKFKKALHEIPNIETLPLIMHFRISTSGGINREMTHPFPLSDNHTQLTAQSSTAAVGIAHNGVLNTPGTKTTSDTYEYIKGQLTPLSRALPTWYKDRDALQVVEHATAGSRLAILTGSGEIIRTGHGWITDNGVTYSNESFRKRSTRFSLYSSYYDDYDPYESLYDYGITTRRTLLQPLYGDCAMIRTDEGEWIDADYYAMDSGYRVYYYDGDYDAWVFVPGYEAFTAEGTHLPFNDEESYVETVLDA